MTTTLLAPTPADPFKPADPRKIGVDLRVNKT
jgi:hypothetical protein